MKIKFSSIFVVSTVSTSMSILGVWYVLQFTLRFQVAQQRDGIYFFIAAATAAVAASHRSSAGCSAAAGFGAQRLALVAAAAPNINGQPCAKWSLSTDCTCRGRVGTQLLPQFHPGQLLGVT